MRSADVVVIGGSAAGVPAALTARRHYPEKSVMIVRKERQVPIPCGIPYIYGTVGSTDKNLIGDAVLEKNGIDLLVDPAVEIDRDRKVVLTESGEEVGYDRLILATGAVPASPPIPGLDKENVFTIEKDVAHLDRILRALDDVRDLVIIGGGFIGVEFADECRKGRDINVTIVEMLPHCLMLAFEEDLCIEAEETLRERGINIVCGVRVEEVLGDGNVTGVRLSNGETLRADAVIVAIGVRPDVELAEKAGLEVDRGGIVVDSMMNTSDPDIYACGDCASKWSFFTGKPSNLRLASIATMEARIAGANLFGKRRECQGVIGVFSTAIGERVFAMAGLKESTAVEEGYDVACGTAEAPNRHPGTMPGMAMMKVKLVFNRKSGEIIGGQIRGGPSAGEMINTISACIQKRMTVDDIATFQLGTHPAVTASPIAYQLVNAAEMALKEM
ncbi:MAG TPA: pyridine nucleotide-disulfide oxidoreductase [Planctomycetaceae bacterium]|nr:pyridine nucleotide-disulfide oxidoreductase [Planctomycetaceae bacterium]